MIDWRSQDEIRKRDARHLFRLDHIFAILLSLIATCPACSSETTKPGEKPKPTTAATEAPFNQVSFQTIDKGSRSGVREPLQTVVRGPAEWKTLWKKHASKKPIPAPPAIVDFTKGIIAGMFLGEKSIGGYHVEIFLAEKSEAVLVIYYWEIIPEMGSIVTQALTKPFHILNIVGGNSLRATFRRAS